MVPGIPSAEELRDISGNAVGTVLPLLRIKLCPGLPITMWPFSLGIHQLDGVEPLAAELAQVAPKRRLHVVDGLALMDDRALLLFIVPPALDGLHPHLGKHLERLRML